MPAKVRNYSNASLGPLGTSWSISATSTPATFGAPNILGSFDFSCYTDMYSSFIIGKELQISDLDAGNNTLVSLNGYVTQVSNSPVIEEENLFDTNTSISEYLYPSSTLYPSSSLFPGAVSSYELNKKLPLIKNVADISATSYMSKLDIDVDVPINTSGQYERGIKLPKGILYTISSTDYYTGGYWESGIFREIPITIYDIAAGPDNTLYVLASGTHDGEVVYILDDMGNYINIFPVYSDATDLSDPGGRFIDVFWVNTNSPYIYIAQVNALRVKKFNYQTLAFISQFGSSGSSNGQFQSIDGLAVTDGVNVSDGTLGRIQKFNLATDAYITQVGTAGTTLSNTVFNNLNNLAVSRNFTSPSLDEFLFAADYYSRIRRYRKSDLIYGNIALGGVDSNGNSIYKIKPDLPIDAAFDRRNNAYLIQDGIVYKCYASYFPNVGDAVPTNVWSNDSDFNDQLPISQFDLVSDAGGPYHITATNDGVLYITDSSDTIQVYSARPNNIKAYLRYYFSLAGSDLPIVFEDINELEDTPLFIPWKGNLWKYICDLLAITKNRAFTSGNQIIVTKLPDTYININTSDVVKATFSSRQSGKYIEYINYDASYIRSPAITGTGEDIYSVVYDSYADNNRTIGINTNEELEITVKTDDYLEVVYKPDAASSFDIDPGEYEVVDSSGLDLSPFWETYGGSVRASVGNNPGDIILKVKGVNFDMGNSPYKIRRIRLQGRGIRTNPETLLIGTGTSEDAAGDKVTELTINSPFMVNADISSATAVLAAYRTGDPTADLSLSVPIDSIEKIWGASVYHNDPMGICGSVIRYQYCDYIVYSATINSGDYLNLNCYRYSLGARNEDIPYGPKKFEEIWDGKTEGEFQAFWATRTCSDLILAPYLNPYGEV